MDNNNLLLNEITDAMRRDRAADVWQKNRVALLVLAISLVAGTALGQVWRHMQDRQAEAFTGRLIAAQSLLQEGSVSEAAQAFAAAGAEAKGEHKALAGLWQARAEIAAGDTKTAQRTLDAVIAGADAQSVWRDAACLWRAGLGGNMPKDCEGAKASPLMATRQEMVAAQALESGDTAKARAALDALRKADTNAAHRARALPLYQLLPEDAPGTKGKE